MFFRESHIRFLETRYNELNFKNLLDEIHDFVESEYSVRVSKNLICIVKKKRKNNFNSTKSWISLKRFLKFKIDKLKMQQSKKYNTSLKTQNENRAINIEFSIDWWYDFSKNVIFIRSIEDSMIKKKLFFAYSISRDAL